MAITEDKFCEMVSKAVAVAVSAMHAQGGGGNGGGGGTGGRVIKDKAFSDVRKFDKGENLWEDWAYDFKVALSTQSPEMKKTLEEGRTTKAIWTSALSSA